MYLLIGTYKCQLFADLLEENSYRYFFCSKKYSAATCVGIQSSRNSMFYSFHTTTTDVKQTLFHWKVKQLKLKGTNYTIRKYTQRKVLNS